MLIGNVLDETNEEEDSPIWNLFDETNEEDVWLTGNLFEETEAIASITNRETNEVEKVYEEVPRPYENDEEKEISKENGNVVLGMVYNDTILI